MSHNGQKCHNVTLSPPVDHRPAQVPKEVCTNVPREQCRQVERQVPKQVEKEVSNILTLLVSNIEGETIEGGTTLK